ncbi:hypothetical protein [Paenibacillus massiliensis]|nr:hypothetical protein [Paenibacillus massiliensis]
MRSPKVGSGGGLWIYVNWSEVRKTAQKNSQMNKGGVTPTWD